MSSLLPTDSVPGEGECLPQTSEASSESDMGEANRGSGPLWSAVSQPETIAAETTGDLVEGITTNAAALTRTHGDRARPIRLVTKRLTSGKQPGARLSFAFRQTKVTAPHVSFFL